MGTLYSQPPRHQLPAAKIDLADRIRDVQHACKAAGIKPSADAILAAALEEQRLHWWIHDRDIWDEQIAGIGKELEHIGNGAARCRWRRPSSPT